VSLDVDLEREQDIEELRRIAQALKAQNALLLEALTKKRRELERLRGKPGDLQLTLKMIEMLQAKTKAAEDALARAEAEQKKRAAERAEKERAPRSKTGRRRSRGCPSSRRCSRSTMPIEHARAAATSCARWTGSSRSPS
jgi:hypothetical protein